MLLKVYKLKFLLALLLVPFLALAQPPAGWNEPHTGGLTHQIDVPVTPTVNGIDIATGDYIGIFFFDGTNYVCAGYTQFTVGLPNPFPAFGDDFLTPEKDGFDPGEDFIWRINASGVDYWATAAYSIGSNQWTFGGYSEVSSLAATSYVVSATAVPALLPFGGGMSTLTANDVSGDPSISWEWFDGATSVGTGNPIIVSVTATTSFKVVAYNGTDYAEASVIVTVSDVYAGADAVICSDPGTYQIADATASGYLGLSWATSGTGVFDDPFSLNPTYTAGAGELSATLTLTVVTLDGVYSDEMLLTVQPAPYITILAGGADTDYICCGEVVPFVDAVAGNYTALQWYVVNSPGGYFDNENVLHPTYYPSAFDCDIDPIIIGVTADPQSPCIVGADDLINLYFVYPPTAFAGAAGAICSDVSTSYTFSDAAVTFDPRYGGTILWETTGDGAFDDATIQNPTYTFGPNDLAANGTINFTLTVETPQACGPVVSTNTITVQQPPSVWAGNSVTICEGDYVNLDEATASNYSLLQWYTTNSVGGYFANESDLNTTFYPGGSDPYLGFCVELWLAAYAIDPCSVSATDSLLVCWQLLPTVVAGPDATVCSHELYTTNPTVENSVGPYLWTVDPPAAGVFAEPTALVTTFNPAAAYEGQTVVLTLTAQPIDPCALAVSGSMNLYIEYAPFVDAGPDMTICDTECATIHGICLHVSMGMWATTGDGTFECPGPGYCLETIYCPGPGDLAAGCVTLVLIGYPEAPCTLYKLDKMVLCFDPHPTANAGPDMTICEDATAQINGAATNTDGIQWFTSGTGFFNDETIANPVYTPSFEDSHLLGSVTLTMLAGPMGACTVHAEDSMVLTLQLLPVVFAGDDAVICENGTYNIADATAANYSSLLWLGGDGAFDNASVLNPTYTPGTGDLAAGSVLISVIAQPITPCVAVATDDMTLSFQNLPTVWAGNSVTICNGDFVELNEATATEYASIQWYTTNSVGGFFDNENALNPTFYPGGTDPDLGYCIELWITVEAISPCTISATDSLLVCFQDPPTVDAGPNQTICEDVTAQLNPVIENGNGVTWATSGTGTFIPDAFTADAQYDPSDDDIIMGYVELTITVGGFSTCLPVSDNLFIYFQENAEVNAGPDQVICEHICIPPFSNGKANLNATAVNYTTVLWTSPTGGAFTNATILNPVYTLSNADITNGSVELCVTVQPVNPCVLTATDCMTITVQDWPQAFAGPDQIICSDQTASLSGSAMYYSGVFWDFADELGNGTWTGQTTLTPTYTPGSIDIAAGGVDLFMVAFPISPCTFPDVDYMHLTIDEAPVACFEDGPVCENIPATFDPACSTGDIIEWAWDFGDGTTYVTNVYEVVEHLFVNGSYTVTLTVTSPACSDSYSMVVTVYPLPVAVCPADFEVCVNGPEFALVGGTPVPGVYTGDGVASNWFYPAVAGVGPHTITYTHTDANGCIDDCTFVITVLPEPTVTCPVDINAVNDPGFCGAILPFEATATGIPAPVITYWVNGVEIFSPHFFEVGTTTVDVIATNLCGAPTCSFNVTVLDTELPTITCPSDVIASTDASYCYATNVDLGTPVTADNCTVASVVNDAVEPFALGTTVVTWTVTDGSGNTATCTQNVTVIDTELPTITCPAEVTVETDAGFCYATGVDLGTPVTADNCSVASVVNDAVEPFALGTTVVTWTVTDGSGNVATCTQNVIVIDTELPTITCPADVTVPTDAGFCYATGVDLGIPVTADNCSVASVVNDAVEPFALGTTVVTWTVTDGSGNVATCTQNVIVIDTELPTITCPAEVTVETDQGYCFATGVDLGLPVVADNCSVAGYINDAVEPFALGTTVVTWTVTDGSGNIATCTQNVIVIDTELPTITCPAEVTVETDAGFCYATGVDLGTPVTTDNCSVASVVNDAVEPFALGTTVVTWTVTDGSGNIATCTQNVIVIDTELPTITCPADVTVPTDAGFCYATGVDLGIPVTADNCSVASVVNDAVEPFVLGTTIVTWTVTDGSGNIATCTQNVIVIDTELPTITCPADVTVETDAGFCYATGVVLGIPVVADNCSVAGYLNDAVEPFALGTTVVTWTVTDGSGNIATCTQNVIVIDNELPTITCPADVTVETDAGFCYATGVDLGLPVVADNCSVAGYINNAVEPFGLGTTVVTWTVTDGSGNIATCEQIVTVIDTELPTIICPPDVTVEVDPGTCFATGVDLGIPTISDNCSGADYEFMGPSEPYSVGTTVVTWMVTDAAGNYATCTQNVNVFAPAPTADAGADMTVCADGATIGYQLVGNATNYLSVLWTTLGDGFFDPEDQLSTVYYPGSDDLLNGSVELCLTVYPSSNCPGIVEVMDCMILTFDPAPTANAGLPITICEGETVTLDGVATNYSSVLWTSAGDGTFDPANVLDPVYTPGVADIANGIVALTLTAYPTGVCVIPATSIVEVTIVPQPEVDLGVDFELGCADFGNDVAGKWDAVELYPSYANISPIVQWTTNGDGTFDDANVIDAVYHIGVNDNWNGEVELCVTVNGLGTCAFTDQDCVVIRVPQQLITINNPGGVDTWWGLSSYLSPDEVTVPGVMEPVVGVGGDPASDLVIMINKQGKYYWPEPEQPINQLGDWAQVGYKAKFDNNCCLPIYGERLVNQTFPVSGAFDYIPVLTNVEVPVADLFAGHLPEILLIYDWAPAQLWTEAAQDFTVLEPGRAYLLVHKSHLSSYNVTFPAYDLNAPVYVSNKSGQDIVNNSPWNDVINTSQSHFILFADEIAKELKPGDIFGAFNENGVCVGMNEFADRDTFLKLIAMGDDIVTDAVDGFQIGENMNFKLYRQETGETFEVSFTYDPQYPSYDGNFTLYGVSRVIGMTMNATSINDPASQFNVNVYPNPANEVINVKSDYVIKSVSLVNYVGQTVFSDVVNDNTFQINVSNYITGMYFVRVETVEGSVITKRITIE